MNCGNHCERKAIATCEICGEGMCRECVDNTSCVNDLLGVKHICKDCAIKNVNELIEHVKARKKYFLKRSIKAIIFYVIGILIVITALVTAMDVWQQFITMFLIGYLLIGIYPVISAFRAAKKVDEEYEAKHGASYTIDLDKGTITKDTPIATKLIYCLFALAFGPIASLVMIINGFIKQKTCDKAITEGNDLVEYLNGRLTEHARQKYNVDVEETKDESDDPFADILFNPDNKEPIVLTGEDGKDIKFEQVAIIPLVNRNGVKEWYTLLHPCSADFDDNEAVTFKVETDRNNKTIITKVHDESVIDKVWDKYEQLLKNK